jgi:hypothetical protein
MDRLNNLNIRQDLTQYAFGLMQDLEAAMKLARTLSPVVPTGTTSGRYNKFDTTAAFKEYADADARRSIGGHATEVGLLTDTANFNEEPYGLRTKIDGAERDNAGEDGIILLEQSKTRTLMINCALAHLASIVTKVRASVSATAGKGSWGEANVNPIKELDDLIEAVWQASGMVPNKCTIDFGAWMKLKHNPNVLKYMPGADVASVTKERLAGLLANPDMEIEIVKTAGLTGGGLGNASATKRSALRGSVYVFMNNDIATPYDPSFCKTFAKSENLFTNIYQYREEPHFDWFENDWTCDVQVVSAGLCKRIDVS